MTLDATQKAFVEKLAKGIRHSDAWSLCFDWITANFNIPITERGLVITRMAEYYDTIKY